MIYNGVIQGSIHFYFEEFQGKKVLAIVDIEPKSFIVNNFHNRTLLDEIFKAMINFAKKYNLDSVALANKRSMLSN